MKQYQKALIIVKEQAKAESKHNKLVKIIVETEDTEFKEVLENLAKAYSLYIKPGWSRNLSNIPVEERTEWHIGCYSEWVTLVNKYKNVVTEFIEGKISQGKPQWQIIAEKNGWAPK